MTQKTLKAYTVSDGDEGSCIVFATNSATARRNGANELNIDWDGVDTCRRAPQFDEWALVGKVPSAAMVAHGWWFECSCCGRRIDEDLHADVEAEGLDSESFGIIETRNAIYCGKACQASDEADDRLRAAQTAAFYEWLDAKLPGYISATIYVCSGGLILSKHHQYSCSSASVKLPGCQYIAHIDFGSEFIGSCKSDQEAIEAFLRGRSI